MATPSPAPDSEVHPLGHVIASVIEDGPNHSIILTDEGFNYIQRALDEYVGTGDALMAAVDTILVAAHFIEIEQASPDIAKRLVTLVDRPEVIASMRKATEAAEAQRAQDVAQSAERFSKFTGEDAPGRAAPGDGAQPKGAVRLGDLAFPKRL